MLAKRTKACEDQLSTWSLRITKEPVLHFTKIVFSQVSTRTSFSFGIHESSGELSAVAKAATPIYARVFCTRESQSKSQSKIAQESMASCDRASLGVQKVSILGPRIQRTALRGPAGSPGDILVRVRESLEHNSLGHTWLPGWLAGNQHWETSS